MEARPTQGWLSMGASITLNLQILRISWKKYFFESQYLITNIYIYISFNSQKIPLLIVPGVTRSWLLATKLEHNINNAWAPSKIHALTVPRDGRMPVLRKYLHEKIFHKNICKIWKCNCWRCHSKCSHAAGLIRGKFVLAASSMTTQYQHTH